MQAPLSNTKPHTQAVETEHQELGRDITITHLPNIFSADPSLHPSHNTTLTDALTQTIEHPANITMDTSPDLTHSSKNDDLNTATLTATLHTTNKRSQKGKAVALDRVTEEENASAVGIQTHKEISLYECIESKMASISSSKSEMAESSNGIEQPVQQVYLLNLSPSARKRERKKKRKEAKGLRQ
ncbi:hypothetical protein OIU76_017026 [Salix suchowensis]|nr:hypothetical protein OIU76_017026 [Salix suchowensis]